MGAVYSYDPVGNFQRHTYRAGGSAASLVQPFLDNQIALKHQNAPEVPLPFEKALRIARDAFTSATERDIHTGDYLEVFVVRADGVTKTLYELKKD